MRATVIGGVRLRCSAELTSRCDVAWRPLSNRTQSSAWVAADGGAAVAATLREREVKLRGLERERAATARDVDADQLRQVMIGRIQNWRDLLQAEPDSARRVLGAFIHGRLLFTPWTDEQGESYLITASASLEGLARASTLANVASPSGRVLNLREKYQVNVEAA